jgi:hypothetical protein
MGLKLQVHVTFYDTKLQRQMGPWKFFSSQNISVHIYDSQIINFHGALQPKKTL